MRVSLSRGGMLLALALTLTAPALLRADEEDPRPRPRARIEEALRRLEQARQMFESQGSRDFPDLRGFMPGLRPAPSAAERRLGAELVAPGEALADQLDLPRGRGLVVGRLAADSPAAKAGLKRYDVLVELNGKPVQRRPGALDKLLADVKAGGAVDAVVVRKGKKETVKGVTLPEAKEAPAPLGLGGLEGLGGFGDLGRLADLFPVDPAEGGVTTINRTNDQFTASHKDGKVSVTVKGTVDQGEAKVTGVAIDDGGGEKTYDGVDKVPAEYKGRVERLARQAAGKAPRR